MSDASSFAKMVPGFDFLQDLVKNAGAALPSIGQWVAPTLNPEELEKRIGELRTVQFWLEQNARMLGATIQALEVQRMTLSTLKTMNVQMEDLRDSLKIRVPGSDAGAGPERAEQAAPPKAAPGDKKAAAPTPEAPPAVDPMQWWGALTKQFTELAANAMTDSAAADARTLAESVLKQGFDAASETFKKAVSANSPTHATAAAGKTANKTAAKATGKAAGAGGRKVASKAGAAARKTAARPAAARKR